MLVELHQKFSNFFVDLCKESVITKRLITFLNKRDVNLKLFDSLLHFS